MKVMNLRVKNQEKNDKILKKNNFLYDLPNRKLFPNVVKPA